MDAEQGRLTQLGVAVVAAELRREGDAEGAQIMDDQLKEEPNGLNGLLYAAITGATLWCYHNGLTHTDVAQFWIQLPSPSPKYPSAKRILAVRLANATVTGTQQEIATIRARFSDALNYRDSLLELATATFILVEEATGLPASQWLSTLAHGAAGGIGIDE